MTPAELTLLMGQASGTYTIADGGEPQLYWTKASTTSAPTAPPTRRAAGPSTWSETTTG